MIATTQRLGNLRPAAELIFLLVCLLAPSFWLLAKISPLWKDADAYLQVTGAPTSSAFLHYGPLYCFLARVPLFLGYSYDCLRFGWPAPTLHFFAQPTLSDEGLWLLLLSQHCALAGATLFLITSATQLFRARLALVLLWAANPLFYTWAHCVASETLSLILVLILATVGFRIATHRGRISPWSWAGFGLLLTLCMLTRYINGVLAALLPLALFLAGMARTGARPKSLRLIRWLRYRAAKDFRRTALAILVGLIAIAASNATLHGFSHAFGIHCHTSGGFTFLFRLGFLAPLSSDERAALLDKIAQKNLSPGVHTVLEILREAPTGLPRFQTMKLLAAIQARLPAEVARSDEKLTAVLQQTAHAFLLPPSRALVRAALADFGRAQKETLRQMVKHPFITTAFFFGHRDALPDCANLATFRGQNRESVLAPPKRIPWLRLGKTMSYSRLLLFGLTSLVLCFFLARDRAAIVAPSAVAFTLLGLAMVFANCFLTEYKARHTLPMWELTIVAITILLGNLFRSSLFAPRN